MSDTIKKYYELVEEGTIDPNAKVPNPKKPYELLTRYNIKDIKKAVEIYENNFKTNK